MSVAVRLFDPHKQINSYNTIPEDTLLNTMKRRVKDQLTIPDSLYRHI